MSGVSDIFDRRGLIRRKSSTSSLHRHGFLVISLRPGPSTIFHTSKGAHRSVCVIIANIPVNILTSILAFADLFIGELPFFSVVQPGVSALFAAINFRALLLLESEARATPNDLAWAAGASREDLDIFDLNLTVVTGCRALISLNVNWVVA